VTPNFNSCLDVETMELNVLLSLDNIKLSTSMKNSMYILEWKTNFDQAISRSQQRKNQVAGLNSEIHQDSVRSKLQQNGRFHGKQHQLAALDQVDIVNYQEDAPGDVFVALWPEPSELCATTVNFRTSVQCKHQQERIIIC
jgi:hypothetical protein